MNINAVVRKKRKYFSFWSIYQASDNRTNCFKSREEEGKNLLDSVSEVSDKSEEVERQQLHVEQLKEIERLKTGNCLKLHVMKSSIEDIT